MSEGSKSQKSEGEKGRDSLEAVILFFLDELMSCSEDEEDGEVTG